MLSAPTSSDEDLGDPERRRDLSVVRSSQSGAGTKLEASIPSATDVRSEANSASTYLGSALHLGFSGKAAADLSTHPQLSMG